MKTTLNLTKNQTYIFATDLDGTFLTDYNAGMHIDNFHAANLIKEKGHYLILTTGRSWYLTEKIYKQLNLKSPIINFAGGQIHHNKQKTFKEIRNSLEKKAAIEKLKQIDFFDNLKFITILGRKYSVELTEKKDINKLFFNVYEIILHLKTTKNNQILVEKTKNIFFEKKFTIRFWNKKQDNFITITATTNNKATALAYIAKHLKIPQKNVIYFGDNINDLEAINWAGYSFVPKNAVEIVKEKANETLLEDNNNGAVAKKIIELLTK